MHVFVRGASGLALDWDYEVSLGLFLPAMWLSVFEYEYEVQGTGFETLDTCSWPGFEKFGTPRVPSADSRRQISAQEMTR